MSDNQKHPYHLVDPSPWPLVTATSLLVLAYGFITFMNNDKFVGSDIFVHHSSIVSKENLYKYLVQGEYVEFKIEKISSHKSLSGLLK